MSKQPSSRQTSIGNDSDQRFHSLLKKEGLTDKTISLFQDIILSFYREEGRSFPWRDTTDPYAIYVSEVMLQQTQTSRVAERFPQFLEAFPSPSALADAPLSAVLKLWQGMGYNRRAVSLKKGCETLVSEQNGQLPAHPERLMELPGIGPYTASAICAFAFDMPTVFIETNIRRVFIHFFFPGKDKVADKDITPLVEKTLHRDSPRLWYSALMDYGAMLKGREENPNRRSAHYTKQKAFEGSNRQLRSEVLRLVVEGAEYSSAELAEKLGRESEKVDKVLSQLEKEGFVREKKGKYLVREK